MIDKFEEMINRIDGIINVKIVSAGENIKEVHIIANKFRAPKQIVRDIESSLIAAYDYRIDRKVISIAQIQTDDGIKIGRIKLEGIFMKLEENLAECSVNLNYNGDTFAVSEYGEKTLSNKRKLIVKSTLRGVEQIVGHAIMFDIQDVAVNQIRDVSYVNVFISMFKEGKEEILIGAAIDNNDLNMTIAKATLDAINRKIQKTNVI